MSENESGGCLSTGCAIWVFMSLISLAIYFISDNSIDKVEGCNFSDITYMLGLPASGGDTEQIYTLKGGGTVVSTYDKEHEKQMESLKKEGFKVYEDFEDILDDNKYIKEVKYTVKSINKEADYVDVSMIFEDEKIKLPVKMRFMVISKSLLDARFAEFLGLASATIFIPPLNNKRISYEDDQVKFLAFLYEEKAIEGLLKKIQKQISSIN